MFAIIAAVIFLLACVGVSSPVALVPLGLLFLAIHLAYPWHPWNRP